MPRFLCYKIKTKIISSPASQEIKKLSSMIYMIFFWGFGKKKIVSLTIFQSYHLGLKSSAYHNDVPHGTLSDNILPYLWFQTFQQSSLQHKSKKKNKGKKWKWNETSTCLLCTLMITSTLHQSSLDWDQCGIEEHNPLANTAETSFSFTSIVITRHLLPKMVSTCFETGLSHFFFICYFFLTLFFNHSLLSIVFCISVRHTA